MKGAVALALWLQAMPGKLEAMAAEVVTASAGRAARSARDAVPVDSGALKASIAIRKDERLCAVVEAAAPYAAAVELGTARRAARPYLRPAALEQRDFFLGQMQAGLAALMEEI